MAEKSFDKQISFELDSLRFSKYLDESKESISSFYADSSLFAYQNITDSLLDTKLCTDSLYLQVKQNYKPYSWGAASIASSGLFSILGVAGVLIANEKMDYKELDSIPISDKCAAESVRLNQQKIRFKYTTYGAIAGILLNTLFVYYKLKQE